MNGCHGYEHTERVVELCKKLGTALNADMDVLIPAAILHDIARGQPEHAEKGAAEAEEVLMGAGFDQYKSRLICDAIRAHSFSGGEKAASLESLILSDADKLDAMGAVGVYRTAMYSGELNRPVDEFVAHFHEKLLTLKGLMHTEEARALAEGRHRYLLGYLKEFRRELLTEA
ncbi:hypothetical protein A3K81_04770 [Candidatus Bathyarchaeota archaeon RBG_13_60_20]|nr:MAG: hypothetical protein A3K81_04770 [Candidatus Bathyarchaeota archaeon RBG_13_60_20]